MLTKKKKWTEKNLREAVKDSTSVRQVLKKIGLIEAGGNYAQIKKYLVFYKIDTKHFKGKGWNKGMKGMGTPLIPLRDILIKNSSYQSYKLKKRLFEKGIRQQKCERCGWAEKSKDGRIPVELDHINGDGKDNRLENLRVLCPNCHSLQSTHRGLNQKRKK